MTPDDDRDRPASDAPDDGTPDAVPTAPLRPVASPDTDSTGGRRLLTAVVAIAVVAGAFGGGFLVGRGTAPIGGDPSPTPPVAVASPGPSAAPTPASTALAGLPREGRRLGRADARVVMEYWADYQCPFCARFALEILPQFASRIADGTLAVVHRDFAFLGPESYDAAVAAHCAGRQDRYWDMHDAMFAAQAGENQGAFAPQRLFQIAAGIGLDATAFAACAGDRDALVAVLDETAAGGRAGITSTPTADVNGRRFLGITDVAEMLAVIDAAAGGTAAIPLPTAAPLPDPWAGVATDGRTAGAGDAVVTVELWVDYQAAGIATLGGVLEPALVDEIEAGTVRLERYDLALLGTESETAAVAVRCVERQDASGWFVHDILGASGGQGTATGLFTDANLLRLASRLRLDVAAFAACLPSEDVLAEVRADTAAGRALGYEAAPVVIVRSGGVQQARFAGTIDTGAVLAAVTAAAGG